MEQNEQNAAWSVTLDYCGRWINILPEDKDRADICTRNKCQRKYISKPFNAVSKDQLESSWDISFTWADSDCEVNDSTWSSKISIIGEKYLIWECFLSGICCTCCCQKHQNAYKYKYKISLWNVLHVVVIVNVKESVFFISSFSEEVGDKYQPIFYCHTWAKLLDLSINFDTDSLFINQTKFFHTRKHCF